MKTSFYLRTLFFCLLTLTFGCGGSDDSGNGDGGGNGNGNGNGNGSGNNVTSSIVISSNDLNAYIGETVTFTVRDNNGADFTSQATITVDGNAITGNTFSTDVIGDYAVQATYDTFTSNTLNVSFDEPPLRFSKNVLIEDYTGTWCGYCPRVAYGIERVLDESDKAVVVATHLSASGAPDPYHSNLAVSLANSFGVSGLPTAKLNRVTDWNYPEPNNVNQVLSLTGNNAELGLALNPTLNGNNMSVEVSVKFGEDFSSTNLKLVVYVLEDGLIYNQTNYTSYYGGGSTIPNFQHDHVLRGSLTSALGDAIPNNETTLENVYTTTLDVAVPSSVSNSANINIVAAVVRASNNVALNSRASDFGVDQSFQEN